MDLHRLPELLCVRKASRRRLGDLGGCNHRASPPVFYFRTFLKSRGPSSCLESVAGQLSNPAAALPHAFRQHYFYSHPIGERESCSSRSQGSPSHHAECEGGRWSTKALKLPPIRSSCIHLESSCCAVRMNQQQSHIHGRRPTRASLSHNPMKRQAVGRHKGREPSGGFQ